MTAFEYMFQKLPLTILIPLSNPNSGGYIIVFHLSSTSLISSQLCLFIISISHSHHSVVCFFSCVWQCQRYPPSLSPSAFCLIFCLPFVFFILILGCLAHGFGIRWLVHVGHLVQSTKDITSINLGDWIGCWTNVQNKMSNLILVLKKQYLK